MEINVREDRKIAEIWLNSTEKTDSNLRLLCARYRSRGYLVAVYRSGGEDLFDLTAGLLMYNRRKLAERPE